MEFKNKLFVLLFVSQFSLIVKSETLSLSQVENLKAACEAVGDCEQLYSSCSSNNVDACSVLGAVCDSGSASVCSWLQSACSSTDISSSGTGSLASCIGVGAAATKLSKFIRSQAQECLNTTGAGASSTEACFRSAGTLVSSADVNDSVVQMMSTSCGNGNAAACESLSLVCVGGNSGACNTLYNNCKNATSADVKNTPSCSALGLICQSNSATKINEINVCSFLQSDCAANNAGACIGYGVTCSFGDKSNCTWLEDKCALDDSGNACKGLASVCFNKDRLSSNSANSSFACKVLSDQCSGKNQAACVDCKNSSASWCNSGDGGLGIGIAFTAVVGLASAYAIYRHFKYGGMPKKPEMPGKPGEDDPKNTTTSSDDSGPSINTGSGSGSGQGSGVEKNVFKNLSKDTVAAYKAELEVQIKGMTRSEFELQLQDMKNSLKELQEKLAESDSDTEKVEISEQISDMENKVAAGDEILEDGGDFGS